MSKLKKQIYVNILGHASHRKFIEYHAIAGIAERGGSITQSVSPHHAIRLVSQVNILGSEELRELLFSILIVD
jgi:hypothetical protein